MTKTHSIPQKNVLVEQYFEETEKYQTKLIDNDVITITRKDNIGTNCNYKHEVVWKNVIGFMILHILAVYGFFLACTGTCKFYSVIWGLSVAIVSSEGVTIGAHRCYAHKSFQAKPLLRALFLLLQTVAGQNSMFIWCRDHRLHHRYSDTDGDPHNAKRGFFFSHIGWLMSKKHPLVIKLGKQIDLRDLQADWMVMFQKKYYYLSYAIFAVAFPIIIPVYYFGEAWTNSIMFCYFFRYVTQLNGTWLVNSAAHLYGTRPYDGNLQPVESWFVSFISLGEGWHNYHHVFPWDYKAAELTMHFNFTAEIIRFLEFVGLAWDLKSASPELVEKRIIRTGDGTHCQFGNDKARSSVTAIGFVHPLNPSYTTAMNTPEATLNSEGLPLFHEEDVLEVNDLKILNSFG